MYSKFPAEIDQILADQREILENLSQCQLRRIKPRLMKSTEEIARCADIEMEKENKTKTTIVFEKIYIGLEKFAQRFISIC